MLPRVLKWLLWTTLFSYRPAFYWCHGFWLSFSAFLTANFSNVADFRQAQLPNARTEYQQKISANTETLYHAAKFQMVIWNLNTTFQTPDYFRTQSHFHCRIKCSYWCSFWKGWVEGVYTCFTRSFSLSTFPPVRLFEDKIESPQQRFVCLWIRFASYLPHMSPLMPLVCYIVFIVNACVWIIVF